MIIELRTEAFEGLAEQARGPAHPEHGGDMPMVAWTPLHDGRRYTVRWCWVDESTAWVGVWVGGKRVEVLPQWVRDRVEVSTMERKRRQSTRWGRRW